MTHTKPYAIALMVLSTVFTSAGQLFWKEGAGRIVSFASVFNLPFLLGCAMYAAAFGLMLLAFRDGEMSVLVPIVATSYVWVSLLSPYFFVDSMNVLKWAGVLVIFSSVMLLSMGSHRRGVAL